MDFNAVCDGIAAAINDAQILLNGKQVTATAFEPTSLTTPQFSLMEFVAQYDKTFGGKVEATFTARLYLSRGDEASSQQALRAAASTAGGVYAAINAARGAPGQQALSGAADDCTVQRVSGPRIVAEGSDQYYVLDFVIFVVG